MLLLSIEFGKYYLWQWVVMGTFLLISTVQDIKYKALAPLICTLWSGIVLILILISRESLLNSGFGLIPGIIVMLCAFFSRQAIGYGDGVAILIIGFALGIERGFYITVIAFAVAAIVGLFLLLFKRAARKTELPFIPFLAFAFMIAGVV